MSDFAYDILDIKHIIVTLATALSLIQYLYTHIIVCYFLLITIIMFTTFKPLARIQNLQLL